MLKILSVGLISLGSLFAVGCQTTGARPAVVRSPDPAVVCDKCNTTWVKTQALNQKGHPIMGTYTTTKAPVCPECKKAAEGYFANGTAPTCDTCGGSVHVVQSK